MNIYDIAKLAGVSIATVSRVVNDSPKVSEKTKAKVRKIMEENHYTPNVFARGMGLNSMNTVGIICPDVSDIYMANAVSYLENNLRKYGYDCILYCSGYGQKDKEKAVERILKKKVDALIFVGSNYAGDGTEKSIGYLKEAAKEMPVFLINGYVRCPGVYCVMADNYQAVYDTVCSMIESGREEILFLYDSESYSAKEKMRGYEDALIDNGFSIQEERKILIENQMKNARELLLEKKLTSFDAVVATGDKLAVGAVKYAKSKGFSVPKDICIVGYNNSEFSICCEPELSSIDSRGEELCRLAIDSLMKLMEGEPIRHKNMIPCHFVGRETTDF